ITDDEILQLKDNLEKAKEQNDETAKMILDAVANNAPVADQSAQATPQTQAKQQQPAQNPAGQAQPIQQNPTSPDQNYPFGMGQQPNAMQPETMPVNQNYNMQPNMANQPFQNMPQQMNPSMNQ